MDFELLRFCYSRNDFLCEFALEFMVDEGCLDMLYNRTWLSYRPLVLGDNDPEMIKAMVISRSLNGGLLIRYIVSN